MALARRSDPWGRSSREFGNSVRSQWRHLAQQRERSFHGARGMYGSGLYTYPSSQTYGAGFGGLRYPPFRRPTYGGGYYGGYGVYGGYGRRSWSSLPRLDNRANRFRTPYPRYTRSPFDHGRRPGRSAFQNLPTFRDYSSVWNPRRLYPRSSYYEDDYFSENEDFDSDDEDDYYSRQDRSYRDYTTDWDDDDDGLSDDEEFEDLESDYDSEFYEDEYDTDGYAYDHRYGRYGDNDEVYYNRRTRR